MNLSPKHKNFFFGWTTIALSAVIIFSLEVDALSLSSSPHARDRVSTINATIHLQVNVLPPEIYKSSSENLTIFELVILSQLQNFVRDSLVANQSQSEYDPLWISTSFLTNLLDSSQWSLQKAKRKIHKAINWRNSNQVNTTTSQLPNLFDYFDLEIKGYDKEACPVVIIPFGNWRSIRSYFEKIKSISEVKQNLQIYFERVMYKIKEELIRGNRNCSQFTLIADMENYADIHTSGVKFFIDYIKQFDKMYPSLLKIAYFINSPSNFLKVARTFKTTFPWDLRRKSFVYTEKPFWKEALLWHINPSHLAPKYGGTNFFLE